MGSAQREPVPDEDALQDWLIEAYRNQGYRCYNWHRKERVNEKGMDIECDSTEKKIALAVKIRPKKEDIKQLQGFSEIAANRRIYVYWNQPTREFQRQLEHSTVESLTDAALNDFLVDHASVGYLNWRFLNTKTLRLVNRSILELYDCEHVPNRNYAKTDLELMWRMKSAAVKIKADIRLAKNYFGEIIIRQNDPSAAAQITASALDQIDMMEADAEEFNGTILLAHQQAPHILKALIDRISPRTGGIDLHVAMQRSEKSARPVAIDKWLIEDKEAHKFLSALNWLDMTLENLEDRFSLFSLGVDWVFEDALYQLWKVKATNLSDD